MTIVQGSHTLNNIEIYCKEGHDSTVADALSHMA